MADPLTLDCPVRGKLKVLAKSKDGLKPTEERIRVEALRYLVDRGYPKAHIHVEVVVKKFGNKGKNKVRTDFAVLDVPVASVNTSDVDEVMTHAIILGEVKRDNTKANEAKATQVYPLLDFAQRPECIAIYWDDVEQRIYWKTLEGSTYVRHEAPKENLPKFGNSLKVAPLTYNDIAPNDALLALLRKIEDYLHSAAIDAEQRYIGILQLLLAKLYDEQAGEPKPTQALELQDFKALGTDAKTALTRFEDLLKKASNHYSHHLKNPVPTKSRIKGNDLLEVLSILAPVRILDSKQSVIQEFYMYFAKHLYRWDLAQYFTPTTVTDFIVELLNPQFGERIKDPACGSADFLTAAFRRGRDLGYKSYADLVFGADNSQNAVQVAVLNMVLNGDGKSNIELEDSLERVNKHADTFDILICNPPFGSKIVERRPQVLKHFDLGHEWTWDDTTGWSFSSRLRDKQEMGILFAEACVKQTKPGGRIGIILPNGYLANSSPKFAQLRDWLLRHCRLAAVCAFPRFTFKKSGADVSASIVLLEKRAQPLINVQDDVDYHTAFEVIERVGWRLGDKVGAPLYKRDSADGSFIQGSDGDFILDSDFPDILASVRSSAAVVDFPWLTDEAHTIHKGTAVGWAIPAKDYVTEPHRTIDAKRWNRKVAELREEVKKSNSFKFGDVVEVVPEMTGPDGSTPLVIVPTDEYAYVEIRSVESGYYTAEPHRGWELPDRARHGAAPRNIFVGSVWSSVGKWFIADDAVDGLLVTNGFHRLRLKAGKEDWLLDVLANLGTETYATQMRALARGSDGLAEVSPADLSEVLMRRVTSAKARAQLQPFVENLLQGRTTLPAAVMDLQGKGLTIPLPEPRAAHTSPV